MHKSAKTAPKQSGVKKMNKKSTTIKKSSTKKVVRMTAKRNIRLTRVSRGGQHHSHEHVEGVHNNVYGQDKWYNPDEDSEFEPNYETPPEGVAAFPFATKPYKFSIRFAQQPDKVHQLNIYEGETYFDAVHRQNLIFPDVKCNVDSTYLQEAQFFDGPGGCGGCVAQFPFNFKNKLPVPTDGELHMMRLFWRFRVHQDSTSRDGGKVDSIRHLCTLNFTPDMDGVEIYALGTNHPAGDADFIRRSDAAQI